MRFPLMENWEFERTSDQDDDYVTLAGWRIDEPSGIPTVTSYGSTFLEAHDRLFDLAQAWDGI